MRTPARVLLDAGADVKAEGSYVNDTANWSALAIAVYESRSPTNTRATQADYLELVELLLARGVDPNRRTAWEGRTPLMLAVDNDVPAVVRTLVKHGADVNAAEAGGRTALMFATDHSIEVVRVLLEAGADVNAAAHNGGTALMNAAYGEPEIVEALLANGAHVNAVDADGDAALIHAARSRTLFPESTVRVTRALIEKGANPDDANGDGMTALMVAARENRIGIVRVLLQGHAKVNERDHDGETALGHAVRAKAEESEQLLRKAGGKL